MSTKTKRYFIKMALFISLLILLLSFYSISCSSQDTSSSDDDDKDDKDEIKTELQGVWEGDEDLNGGTWTITFTGYTGFAVKQDGTESFNFLFVLNKSVTPNQLDMTLYNCIGNAVTYENETSLGIYQLIGNNLTLTGNVPGGGARPNSFGAKGNDPVTPEDDSCRNWNLIRN